MTGGGVEREKASSTHDPLLGTLRKMRLICPFAVSPAKYGARQELSVSCFCWFQAEQHRAGLANDVGSQILAACMNPATYAPWLGALRKMRLVCPFAVSPANYGARQELWASCYCWFQAEKHRGAGGQIPPCCADPTAYAACAIQSAVKEV